MARCLGNIWPCDHAEKHAEAAKRGWLTRRHGAQFAGTKAHKALSALFGEEVSHAHEDTSHKGMIRFKNAGKWWELPKQEFNRLTREGVSLLRDQERASKKSERDAARAEREEERQRLQGERYKAAQERQLAAARKAEYQNVVKSIRQMGGIRPYKSGAGGKNKNPELEEWRDLPQSVKTRDEHKGRALDDAAATIHEEFPWLKIQNDEDLRQYLTTEQRQQRYSLKKPHLSEPKPKVVISQNRAGQWLVNRLYPDGEVRGDPGTYPTKAAAEKAASSQRAAGAGVVKPAMFGEEQQKRESYGEGLFG